MRRGLFVFLAALILLAGCTSGNTPGGIKNNKPPSTAGVDDASKGKIMGVVTNDEEVPLEGAAVAILTGAGAISLAAVTDAAGNFAFLGVEPGSYILTAQKVGFTDYVEKNLQVAAGDALEKSIRLVALPRNEPYSETHTFDGMSTGWGYKTPVVGPVGGSYYYAVTLTDVNNNGDQFKTTQPPTAMQNMVAEMQWQNSQTLAGNLQFVVSVAKQAGNPEKRFVDKQGPSPVFALVKQPELQAIVNKADEECKPDGKACNIAIYVYPGVGNTNADADFALAFMQRFSSKVTVFYHMDAPGDFSGFR
jgi:carboxypeptidase family protein